MADYSNTIKIKKICCGEEVDVIYRKLPPRPAPGAMAAKAIAENRPAIFLADGFGDYPELNPRTYDVADDIICIQDVMIPMRDGCKTYCDIYLPKTDKKVPAILVYSFYGKRPAADTPEVEYYAVGVPVGSTSRYCKFEGPDPLYWCRQGYAICNYDHRGVGNSDGDIAMAIDEEGIDAYDAIEFLAEQEWCNGNVGMAGNSGLAAIQWKAASKRPPHLKCIAPWEGCTDTYRELINMGGITECGFNPFLTSTLYGPGYMEDHYLMSLEHPFFDNYWKDKCPKCEDIVIPAYVTGGWNHFHLRGSISGWHRINTDKKWIRIHRDFEWPDQYKPENLEDLKRFFDRYLKEITNGWEGTPHVRIDVMDAYDKDQSVRRPMKGFPVPNTEYKKLWLDAGDCSLNHDPITTENKVSYDGNAGKVTFDYTFAEETALIGYSKLRLWVEADGNDDMDLFIALQKADANGNWIPTSVLGAPHPGAAGRLRVSLRELDEELSSDIQPVSKFNNPQKLKKGEIVPVDIEIWPSSRIWHKGEKLRIEVMGHYERIGWFEPFDYHTDNAGNHIIHTGGKYDSYVQIPVVSLEEITGAF